MLVYDLRTLGSGGAPTNSFNVHKDLPGIHMRVDTSSFMCACMYDPDTFKDCYGVSCIAYMYVLIVCTRLYLSQICATRMYTCKMQAEKN